MTRFLQQAFLLIVALSISGALFAATGIKDVRRLVNEGNLTEALKEVEDIIDEKPRDSNARFLKGLILTRMHRAEEAILVFQELTQDFPEFAEPWNNLAVLYAQEGKLEDAMRALQMAIKTYPDYPVPYENLGDIYLRLAIESYAKANSLDSKSAVERLNLSRTLLKHLNTLDTPSAARPDTESGKTNATAKSAKNGAKPETNSTKTNEAGSTKKK